MKLLQRSERRGTNTPIFIFMFFMGIFLIGYPTFSNWWNEQHQSRAIASYDGMVADKDDADIEEMLAAAEAYNDNLREARANETLTMGILNDEQLEEYNSLVDVSGTGIMGYIRIPKINVELPIYHGTDEAVLQIAVGHIEGTSLPVGGKGTHAVLSGHTGLPSATLFTDLNQLGIGDVFMITCLNRKVTYEVDQIDTVLPAELDDLDIDPDQDYCTLVTCTPYGVNSHRLLVRGHRIENLLDDQIKTINIDVPEHEMSLQEKINNILLPYVLILAAGFFGIALILPYRNPEYGKSGPDNHRGSSREQRRRRDRDDRRKRRRERPQRGDHAVDRGPQDSVTRPESDDHWNDDDRHDAHATAQNEPEFYDDDDVTIEEQPSQTPADPPQEFYDDDEFYDE